MKLRYIIAIIVILIILFFIIGYIICYVSSKNDKTETTSHITVPLYPVPIK